MIYSRPASGMVFTKPRLAGPSGIIIQQDRRFGNTFGNGFEIAVQLDITDCTSLSWVLYLIFILALYEIPGSCLQTSPMQPPDHLKCDLMFCYHLQRKSPYPHRLDGIGLSGRTQKSSLK
jgi:hypothetical protein